jgi:prolyl oligopeptidase
MHFTGADPGGEDFLLQVTGYLQPSRLQLWRNGRPELQVGVERAAFEASGHVVEVGTAISRDGTPVPYYVVRPITRKAGAVVPTLMTGYGAFGITMPPAYLDEFMGGRSLAFWLAHGGALVVPLIRGGGEFGSNWHQAAMRDRRQKSYDDFIAVAQALVDSGFTSQDRLGVFGGSNGGLLAAVVGTQRPDLFAAVACDVPLADMLRYPRMGFGALWMDEYGDPNDPAMAQVLRGYSPVHNIRAGIDYPPFLITTSTEDDRVGPGHARKLAARLIEVGATTHFIEVEEGGHGASNPLARPDLTAMWMTFLMDHLMPRDRSSSRAAQPE